MTVIRSNPKVGTPEYGEAIDATATRGADAIQKMPEADRDAIVGQLPGRLGDISRTLQKRVLGRSQAELEASIAGGRHFEPTAASGDRLATLKEAVSEEKAPRIAAALADIAKTAEVDLSIFDRLVQKLELVAELAGRDLSMIPAPTRSKIQSLADGDLAKLPSVIAQELGHYAYKPLGDSINRST